MLTIATGIADVIMPMTIVVGYYAFTGLISSRSPMLGLTYLKTEAR
jgi:hypothetical protein